MPYTLKTKQIFVKDSENGDYTGVDVLAEQNMQDVIATIQATGTEVEERIDGYVAGINVTSNVAYQTSASGTNVPSGTWYKNVPAVEAGYFLWTRVITTYKSDAGDTLGTTTSYSVSHNGLNGTGSMVSVNGQQADNNGNATVYGNQIQMSSGDTTTLQAAINGKQTAIGSGTAILKRGTTAGNVANAVLGTDYGAKTITNLTLAKSSWSSSSLSLTLSNSDFITSGYVYFVEPATASRDEYAKAGVYADDVTTAGKMVFHCKKIPSGNLAVRIVRVVSA